MEEQRQRQEEEVKRNQQPAAPKEITIPEDNEEGGEVHGKGEPVDPQLVPSSYLPVVYQLQGKSTRYEDVGDPNEHVPRECSAIERRLNCGLP